METTLLEIVSSEPFKIETCNIFLRIFISVFNSMFISVGLVGVIMLKVEQIV
jgi:hypothetical protein